MAIASGRLVVRNFLSLALGEAGYIVFRFVAVVYLARVLLVEGFGRLNFAVALVTYFMLLVNMGLNELGVREIARKPDEVADYVGIITTLRTTLALIAFCLLVFTCRWISLSRADMALVLIVGGMLFTYGLSVEWAFRGLERMGVVGRARALNSLAYLIAVIAVVRGIGDLILVGVCLVGAELISVAYLYRNFWRRVGFVRFRFDFGKWVYLLRQSLPIGLAFAMNTTLFQVDIILLGLMKDETAVGLYSASSRLISIFYTLSIVYVSAMFPQISRRAKKSPEELREFMVQASRAAMLVMLPLGLLATLLARPILGSLYGASYLGATLAFQVLAWSLVVYVLGHLLSYSLVAQDRQGAYLFVLTVGAVVNVVLNLLCIGPFGISGAAVARLVTQVILLILAYGLLNRMLGLSLTKDVLRAVAATAVMGMGLLLGLNWPLPILMTMALSLYIGTLFLFQGITSADVRMLREIVFPR